MKIQRLLILFLTTLLMRSFCTAQVSEGRVIGYGGSIGKNSIIAELQIIDSTISGYYYPVKTKEVFKLNGVYKNSEMIINEEVNDSIMSELDGKISSDYSTVNGIRKSNSQKKSLPFVWKSFHSQGNADLKVISKKYNYVWKKNKDSVELGCKAYYSICLITGLPYSAVENKINNELLESDEEEYTNEDEVKSASIELMDDNFDSYQEDFDSAYTKAASEDNLKYINESPAAYQWRSTQTCDVLFNANYLLTIRQQDYEFTGGAHGSTDYTNMVFSLKTGLRIHLNDLFVNGFQTQLNQLAALQLMSSYKAGSFDQLNAKGFLLGKEFSVNDNFFIQANGVGFTFNPYEIATYSMGIIQVIIPWASLQHLIKPEGPLGWALEK